MKRYLCILFLLICSISFAEAPAIHYKMNDNAANATITDDGTIGDDAVSTKDSGVINTNTRSVSGLINNAIDFDKPNEEYIDNPSVVATVGGDTYGSFCYWFNVGDDTVIGVPFMFSDASSPNWYIYTRYRGDTTDILQMNSQDAVDSWGWSSDSTFSAAGGWYHHCVVQDGTYPVIYIDSSSEGTFVDVGDATDWFEDWYNGGSNADSWRIGAWEYNGAGATTQWFDGQIDDFRYYSEYALSSSEVGDIYNSGNGTEVSDPSATGRRRIMLVKFEKNEFGGHDRKVQYQNFAWKGFKFSGKGYF